MVWLYCKRGLSYHELSPFSFWIRSSTEEIKARWVWCTYFTWFPAFVWIFLQLDQALVKQTSPLLYFQLVLNHISSLLGLQTCCKNQLKLFCKQRNQSHPFVLQRKTTAAGAQPGTPDRVPNFRAHTKAWLIWKNTPWIQCYIPSESISLDMKRNKHGSLAGQGRDGK